MKSAFNFTEKKRRRKSFKLTGWTIWALEKLYDTSALEAKLNKLKTLEKGTVGREVAEMLDQKGYRLIPKFENRAILK
jgi:hypothetical protein